MALRVASLIYNCYLRNHCVDVTRNFLICFLLLYIEMFYYFLTIDRAESKLRIKPTKEMYYNVFYKLQLRTKMDYTNLKFPVRCFEYKKKGSIKKGNKVCDWLHYHCIVQCKTKVDYSQCVIKNYSIVWKPIHDLQTMSFYAGYINKDKSDKVDIVNIQMKESNNKIIKKDIRSYFECKKK